MVAVELKMVALAAIVLFVHLAAPATIRALTFGASWALGPRDTIPGEISIHGQRCERAYRNMLETFPLFTALAIAVVVAGLSNQVTALGSGLYVIARVLYLPAYIFPIPFVRTACFGFAMLGILLTGAPLFGALLS